jgi:hypothetical protein
MTMVDRKAYGGLAKLDVLTFKCNRAWETLRDARRAEVVRLHDDGAAGRRVVLVNVPLRLVDQVMVAQAAGGVRHAGQADVGAVGQERREQGGQVRRLMAGAEVGEAGGEPGRLRDIRQVRMSWQSLQTPGWVRLAQGVSAIGPSTTRMMSAAVSISAGERSRWPPTAPRRLSTKPLSRNCTRMASRNLRGIAACSAMTWALFQAPLACMSPSTRAARRAYLARLDSISIYPKYLLNPPVSRWVWYAVDVSTSALIQAVGDPAS